MGAECVRPLLGVLHLRDCKAACCSEELGVKSLFRVGEYESCKALDSLGKQSPKTG